MCKTTVAIPLYRSARFLDSIITNIEVMPEKDIEILISDRHCLDDAIDILQDRYSGDSRVRCIKAHDEIDWVGNMNFLLKEAKGDYVRLLPHDDLSPKGSLELLVDALDRHQDVVLAYGPTRAIDREGRPFPEKDRCNPHPEEARKGWTLDLALQLFWKGFFDGAFKGLVRRQVVMEKKVFIRSTIDQIFPERCWLFALCFLGKFRFIPDAVYIKRYYDESTHASWRQQGKHVYSAAKVMITYMNDLLGFTPEALYGYFDIMQNAVRLAKYMDHKRGHYPPYQPAPETGGFSVREMIIG